MTITFKQTFYRIQPPLSGLYHARPALEKEIEKALDNENYPHILKEVEGLGIEGEMLKIYLFFNRDDAFGVQQDIMRSLGLLEEGWDEEDIVLDGADDLEIDDTPEDEQWRIVGETIILNAQEA